MPSFQLKPEEDSKFYPSQAQQIAQEILEEDLSGKVITLVCGHTLKFQPAASQIQVSFLLLCQIDDKWVEEWADFGDEFESLSKNIADKIKEKIKSTLNLPRYKLMTQVTIGQSKDQGVRITSRCLWDTTTDNYATASFQNQHIWASAIVFAFYTDWE